jgi:hypothetical protein
VSPLTQASTASRTALPTGEGTGSDPRRGQGPNVARWAQFRSVGPSPDSL